MSDVKLFYKDPVSTDLIRKTFEASFNIKFDEQYWTWRFLNNPNTKKTYISYIEEDGVLAAYYAISPMKILVNGNIESIALSNMTMTHPDYRGRGYFKKLAKALFDDLKNDGFIGVFGFANHNSHYGFRKYLNWIDLSALNLFSVSPENFRGLKIDRDLASFSIEPINEEIIESVKTLSVGDKHLNQLLRDGKNIEWRLKNNPVNTYKVLVGRTDNKIVSLLFYKKYKNQIDVLEFFYHPKINKVGLLNLNMAELIAKTNSNINMWSNLHSEEHVDLEKQGFQESNFITFFGVIPFIENVELLDFRKWHFRFMDSDIF